MGWDEVGMLWGIPTGDGVALGCGWSGDGLWMGENEMGMRYKVERWREREQENRINSHVFVYKKIGRI
jgi:flavin-dependent dehydrogenase